MINRFSAWPRQIRYKIMTRIPFTTVVTLAILLALRGGVRVAADEATPFKGTFQGQAISAVPTADPLVPFVTTQGTGEATHLGRYNVVSPHYFNVVTLEVVGTFAF